MRFECKLRAKPEAKIKWLKEKKELTNGKKYKIEMKKESENVFILILEIQVRNNSFIFQLYFLFNMFRYCGKIYLIISSYFKLIFISTIQNSQILTWLCIASDGLRCINHLSLTVYIDPNARHHDPRWSSRAISDNGYF